MRKPHWKKKGVKERAAIQAKYRPFHWPNLWFYRRTTVKRDNFPGFLYRRVTRQMFFVTPQIVPLYTVHTIYKNINCSKLCRCVYRLIISRDGQRWM